MRGRHRMKQSMRDMWPWVALLLIGALVVLVLWVM